MFYKKNPILRPFLLSLLFYHNKYLFYFYNYKKLINSFLYFHLTVLLFIFCTIQHSTDTHQNPLLLQEATHLTQTHESVATPLLNPTCMCRKGVFRRIFALMLGILYTLMYLPAQTNEDMYFTPDGIFDTLYDDMGNHYGINELIVSPATGGTGGGMNTEGGTTDYSCDCGGYFELYYEAGSGMEILSNATHAARRAVLCQVMCDLSAFIVPANANTKVKIHVRSMSALYGTNTPPISVGSGYYCIEPFLNTLGSIVDNQVWRTINSGTDAYQGFGNPFTSITFPFVGTATGAMFYSHGFIAFDFDNYNWNTDLATNPTTGDYDLYTIALREMLQTLGLASGIDAQMPTYAHSQIQGRYTRYDKFLKTSPNLSTNANIPLINNTGQCGQMYNYSWYNFAPTPQLTPAIGNECTIWFRGNVNQAVHSTSNNSVGKRFGYFEDLCHAPNQEYAYYVNSEGETTGLMKRFPKLEERIALCDIGYTTTNVYGVVGNINLNYHQYEGLTCHGGRVAGVNDGINSQNGGGFTFVFSSQNTTPFTLNLTGVDILNNDFCPNPANLRFECLEVIAGGLTLNTTAGDINTPLVWTNPSGGAGGLANSAGLILLRYVPYDISTGIRGNITYIYAFVQVGNCNITTICPNIISDGGFEGSIGCGAFGPSAPPTPTPPMVNCWNAIRTPDIYERNCTNNGGTFNIPTNTSGVAFESHDGLPNNHFSGMWGSRSFFPSGQTTTWWEGMNQPLFIPMMSGQSYKLSFWAQVNTNWIAPNFTNPVINNQPAYLDFLIGNGLIFSGTVNTINTSLLIDGVPSNQSLAPLMISNIPAPLANNTNGWHHYEIFFTTTNVFNMGNGNFDIWFNPTNIGTAFFPGQNASVYVFLDDFSITWTNISTALNIPTAFCGTNGLISLNQFATQTGGQFFINNQPVTPINGQSYFDPAIWGTTGNFIITYTFTDPNGCNLSAQDTLVLAEALEITKTADATTYQTGDEVTYSIVVTNPNTNTTSFQGLTITDLLPTQLEANTAAVGGNSNLGMTVTNGEITSDIFALAPGQSILLEFTVRVLENATSCSEKVTNTATVSDGSCAFSASTSISIIPSGYDLFSGNVTSYDLQLFYNGAPVNYLTPILGKNIYIDGTLSVIQDYAIAFHNCDILFSGGSSIIVNGSVASSFSAIALESHATTFHSCDTMWKGITLMPGSGSVMFGLTVFALNDGSQIQDAECGISFGPNCAVSINNGCRFDRNVIAIKGYDNPGTWFDVNNTQFDGAGPFLPPYIGQLALPGNTGFVGISLFNITHFHTNSGNLNTFKNLNMGIQLAKTNADIKLCQFENIHKDPFYNTWGNNGGGAGIYGLGTGIPYQLNQTGYGVTPTFDKCDIGIFTHRMNADISQNTMKNMYIGTQTRNSAFRKVKIYDNNIQTTGGGIVLENNAWANWIQIENNDITLGNPNLNQWMGFYGIYGTDGIPTTSTSYGTSWNLFLVNNRIKVGRALAGIYFNGVPLADVYSNRITFDDNTNWTSRRGIALENAHRNYLHCNQVNDPGVAAIIGYSPEIASGDPYQSAYYTSMSVKNTFEGNHSHDTYYGFRFMGACNNTDFKANDIYEHENGLYVDGVFSNQGISNAGTNPGYDNGNHWLGAYLGARLAANNIGNYTASKIYSSTPPPLLKRNPQSGWIIPLSTPYNTFSTNCAIPTPIAPPNDSSNFNNLDYLVASDSLISPIYPQETKWQMEKELYERIIADSIDVSNDSLMRSFVDSKAQSPIESFRNVSANYRDLHQENPLRDSLEIVIQNILSQLKYNDSLLSIGGDSALIYSQNDSLHAIIATNTSNLEEITSNQKVNDSTSRVQILTQNGLIDVTEIYEENEQIVNDIYFRTIAADNYDFTQDQLTNLASVAYQCPLAGGAAVYRARGMYQSATGFVFFDDTDLCQQQNINWRKAATITSKTDVISIYPNPVDNMLTFSFGTAYAEKVVFICNAMGQKIIEFKLPKDNQNTFTISVSDLATGFYFVKVGDDFNQKLVIQH